MTIERFEDKGLAHFSYAIMSEGRIALIDPARDPAPYYEYANLHDAHIEAVIETHAHADFVSSHHEIGTTKEADIYTSKFAGASYKHIPFDDGDSFALGEVTLHAINTPGHSPDSICVLLYDEDEQPQALFTGDTLFVGDVGRPDLHESTGASTTREALASDLYRSIQEKIMPLPDALPVYPAHGAGSLCGKAISSAPSSTLGAEKETNPALREMPEAAFVQLLLADQPFVPAYFPYNVKLNKTGAPEFKASISSVPFLAPDSNLEKNVLIIDTRPAVTFKQSHLPGAINLQNELKFETWLGSVIKPEEKFYLVTADEEETQAEVIAKTAKIGYEKNIVGVLLNPAEATQTSPETNVAAIKDHPEDFTIVDVRNPNEVKAHQPFAGSLVIPLPELRSRVAEIPTDKPIVVHCAGGYRSAVASSLLARKIKDQPVYDLGEAIRTFV